MKRLTAENLDLAFAILEASALAGERCPLTDGTTAHPFLTKALVAALAASGRIQIALSGRSWRQVTLLTGANAGAKTLAGPDQIFMIIDVNGARRTTPVKKIKVCTRARIRPSAPRLLTSAEIFK